MAVLRRHLLPNVHFQCCMVLQGTLGDDVGLRPAVNPLPGCSSGQPVQDQLAGGFVLKPNSTFAALHLTRVKTKE